MYLPTNFSLIIGNPLNLGSFLVILEMLPYFRREQIKELQQMDTLKKGIAERLAEVLSDKNENASSLANKLGKTNSNIYGLLDPNKDSLPNTRLLIGILEQFPDLSHKWFLTGKGDKWINDEIYAHAITDLTSWQAFVDMIEALIPTEKELTWKKYKRGLYVSFHGWNEFTTSKEKELSYKLLEMEENIETLKAQLEK